MVAFISFEDSEDWKFKRTAFWYWEWYRLLESARVHLTFMWRLSETLLFFITSIVFEMWRDALFIDCRIFSIFNKRFVFVCNVSANRTSTLVKLFIFICRVSTITKLASLSSFKIRYSARERVCFSFSWEFRLSSSRSRNSNLLWAEVSISMTCTSLI